MIINTKKAFEYFSEIIELPIWGTALYFKMMEYKDYISANIEEFKNIRKLRNMIKDEAKTVDVYTRQVFGLARVNAEKYRNIRRAILLVIIALAAELTLVAYLFIYYHGQGATLLPPITG